MKLSVLIFVLIINATGSCQIDIENKTAINQSDSLVIIRLVKEPNILKITGLTDSKSFQLKSSKIQFEKTKASSLFNASTKLHGLDTLYLLDAGKVIFTKPIWIVNPEPIRAVLGSVADSTATVAQIITYPLLRAVIPNCKCFPGHVIGGFTVKFVSNYTTPWEKTFDIIGGRLDHLIGVIKKLQPKDKMIFENIRTIDVDSSPWKLADLTVTIK